MDVIKRALENIRRMWGNFTSTQRIILAAASVGMVTLLAWGTASSTSSTWVRLAGAELDQEARARIFESLKTKGQRHEVRGVEIYVPREDADRLVLELAGDGAMSEDAIWKFLEDDNIFRSKDDKDRRSKRALEQKLVMMIRKIEAVKNASVVISPGSTSSRFGFEGDPAKASVQVELHEGRTLSSKNVIAIAGLVAKAVQGVRPDQVHIMDTRGNPYKAPGENDRAQYAAFWRDHEKTIEDDIARMIKQAFRGASIAVRIQAQNTESRRDEIVRTNPKAGETEEISRKMKAGSAGGIAPIKGEAEYLTPQTGGRGEEEEKESREKNVFDERKIVTTLPAGKIERITVGVLIPVEVGADGKEMAEAEKQLPKLREWVLKAAGPEAKDEDVSVQFLPSQKPEPVSAVALTERIYEWASVHWTKIALFSLAFVGLVFLLRLIHGAFPKDTVEELQALTNSITQSLESAQAAAELNNVVTGPEGEILRAKQGIKDMIGKNPQTVAASIKGFMSGK